MEKEGRGEKNRTRMIPARTSNPSIKKTVGYVYRGEEVILSQKEV